MSEKKIPHKSLLIISESLKKSARFYYYLLLKCILLIFTLSTIIYRLVNTVIIIKRSSLYFCNYQLKLNQLYHILQMITAPLCYHRLNK